MSKVNFLENIDFSQLETVKKGSYSGGRRHEGLYVNNQGRLFNFSDEKNEDVFGKYYRISTTNTKEGITALIIKQVSEKDKMSTDFQVSAKSTKTPFITVTNLCKDLFGNDKSTWMHDFECQGQKDGNYVYTVITDKAETTK